MPRPRKTHVTRTYTCIDVPVADLGLDLYERLFDQINSMWPKPEYVSYQVEVQYNLLDPFLVDVTLKTYKPIRRRTKNAEVREVV